MSAISDTEIGCTVLHQNSVTITQRDFDITIILICLFTKRPGKYNQSWPNVAGNKKGPNAVADAQKEKTMPDRPHGKK